MSVSEKKYSNKNCLYHRHQGFGSWLKITHSCNKKAIKAKENLKFTIHCFERTCRSTIIFRKLIIKNNIMFEKTLFFENAFRYLNTIGDQLLQESGAETSWLKAAQHFAILKPGMSEHEYILHHDRITFHTLNL